jgi:hypothetical protein
LDFDYPTPITINGNGNTIRRAAKAPNVGIFGAAPQAYLPLKNLKITGTKIGIDDEMSTDAAIYAVEAALHVDRVQAYKNLNNKASASIHKLRKNTVRKW